MKNGSRVSVHSATYKTPEVGKTHLQHQPLGLHYTAKPQVTHITVYAGCIIIAVLLFLRQPRYSFPVILPLCLWCAHFCKRISEVVRVHLYSVDRLPLVEVIGELLYYWLFSYWIWSSITHKTLSDKEK